MSRQRLLEILTFGNIGIIVSLAAGISYREILEQTGRCFIGEHFLPVVEAEALVDDIRILGDSIELLSQYRYGMLDRIAVRFGQCQTFVLIHGHIFVVGDHHVINYQNDAYSHNRYDRHHEQS